MPDLEPHRKNFLTVIQDVNLDDILDDDMTEALKNPCIKAIILPFIVGL